jgi:hypothetical protein
MPFSQPGQDRVNTFTASFDSEGACGHEIYEGDEAGYLPGEDSPVCGECVEEFRRESE